MKTLPHGTQDNILEKILLIPSCQNSAKVWPLMNLHIMVTGPCILLKISSLIRKLCLLRPHHRVLKRKECRWEGLFKTLSTPYSHICQHPTFPGPPAQNNFRIVTSDIALGDDNLPDVNIDELFDDMYEESRIVSTQKMQ